MPYIKSILGLELKALAAYRVGISLAIIAMAFSGYSANSLAARGELQQRQLPRMFDFLEISLVDTFPYLRLSLLALIVLISLILLLGYKTRWVTLLCFCSCSLASLWGIGQFSQLNGVLLPTLFWSIFLPLGSLYSLDSAMNPNASSLPNSVVSSAAVALLIQQCSNYWLLGSPVALSSIDLLDNVNLLTQLLLVLDIIAGLMLFMSDKRGVIRHLTIFLFSFIHLIVFLLFRQGLAPTLLVIAIWLAFLPGSVWESLAKYSDREPQRGLVIYYDADCGFCKKVVHILRTLLILPSTPLLTAQSNTSICHDMETYNSWVVVDWEQRRHFKFEAIAYICSISPVLWFLAPIVKLSFVMKVGTRFYETIANNRKRAGLLTKFLKFRTIAPREPNFVNFVIGVFLITYVVFNFPLALAKFRMLLAV